MDTFEPEKISIEIGALNSSSLQANNDFNAQKPPVEIESFLENGQEDAIDPEQIAFEIGMYLTLKSSSLQANNDVNHHKILRKDESLNGTLPSTEMAMEQNLALAESFSNRSSSNVPNLSKISRLDPGISRGEGNLVDINHSTEILVPYTEPSASHESLKNEGVADQQSNTTRSKSTISISSLKSNSSSESKSSSNRISLNKVLSSSKLSYMDYFTSSSRSLPVATEKSPTSPHSAFGSLIRAFSKSKTHAIPKEV